MEPDGSRELHAPPRIAPPRTIPELLAVRAGLEPERVAIETYGVTSLTFAGWDARASVTASGLLELGLVPGDRVVLSFGSRDWADYAVAFCGVLRAGGVAVPCSDHLAGPELAHVVAHSGASMLVHAGRAAPAGTPAGCRAVTLAQLAGVTELCGAVRTEVDVRLRATDPAQILYTSGTTGRPKGVSASHANLTAGAPAHPRRRPLGHSDRFLHAFPVGTNAGQTMLLNALMAKPTAITLPQFTSGRFARLIEAYEIGSVFVVPAMAIELLQSGALARHDMSSVLLFGSTAAALPAATATALAAAFPNAAIVNYYTSTEAAPAQTSMIFDPLRPGALGRAVAGDLRILDEEGRPVPADVAGQVWLRSPHPRAYFRDEEAGREVFRAGWVRMGDVGRLDADGYLYLVDRNSDLIKSGAYKVSTLQVEAELHAHHGVSEAAVFGVPHPVLGMAVAAAIVRRAGVPQAETAPAELRAFLRQRLAGHEIPGQMIFVDRLPRNAGGKVLKRDLVAQLIARDSIRSEGSGVQDGSGIQDGG